MPSNIKRKASNKRKAFSRATKTASPRARYLTRLGGTRQLKRWSADARVVRYRAAGAKFRAM